MRTTKNGNAREIMNNFGKRIDMVAGVYSDNLLKERNCTAIHLYDAPLCLAVPKLHPLASKEVIQLENLEDESILILQRYYLKPVFGSLRECKIICVS